MQIERAGADQTASDPDRTKSDQSAANSHCTSIFSLVDAKFHGLEFGRSKAQHSIPT